MGVKTGSEILDSGIRPFGYRVEYGVRVAGQVNPKTCTWQEKLVALKSVSVGYGTDGSTAQFQTHDPRAISEDSPIETGDLIQTPANGDAIRITANDGSVERVIFKGTVQATHETKQPSGTMWSAEAASEIQRLNDIHFTGSYNQLNDPIKPQPRFDQNGFVGTSLYTVREIIQCIMNYHDAWGSSEYFSYNDIVWHGLDTDKRCGQFLPSNISFDNTPKGKAILDVLRSAGNYTFVYDPATDKIHIVELNTDCNACGSQWNIRFASTDAEDIEDDEAYAYEYDVASDRTTWSSTQAANVCRITTGPIEFYSGNYLIPERVINTDATPLTDDDKLRSISPDGAFYRFVTPSKIGSADVRNRKDYYVGLPLFPDWNIFEDWLPAIYEIGEVSLPSSFTGPAATAYTGKCELQPFTIGHNCAKKQSHLGHVDNLKVYQAWHVSGPCPACHGTGWVQAIYTNDNIPHISLTQQGPDGCKRWMMHVTNWIMPPSDFGALDASGVRKLPPHGLVPFIPEDESQYPVPWKNTCPYCRGVGMKPDYRIRNICGDLFAGRSLQANMSSGIDDIPMDPDATQAGPERWEAANDRHVLAANEPLLQVEVPVLVGKYFLPTYGNRNISWAAIDQLIESQKNYSFDHPLAPFFKQLWLQRGELGITATDTEGPLVPRDWKCHVPYTLVQMGSPYAASPDWRMGRIIFNEPVFIPCYYDWATIHTLKNNVARVDSNGLLMTHSPARGYESTNGSGRPIGYWRPARVWATFKYIREQYFHNGLTNPASRAIASTEFTADPFQPPSQADPVEGKDYEARAAIVDGCYCLEVRKAGESGRMIQNVINDPYAKLEIFEQDFWKMPVPTGADMTQANLHTAKTNAGYSFTQARCITWETTTPGERIVEMAGYSSADYYGSISRPKVRSWYLRDDRSRMMGLAVRQLESCNDLQVEGSVTLVGMLSDTSTGLGFVDYPDKGKVAVIRLTYNYAGGFTTELELHREETRLGELPPSERDRQHQVTTELTNLRKIVDIERSRKTTIKANPNQEGASNSSTAITGV